MDNELLKRIDAAIGRMTERGHDPGALVAKRAAVVDGTGSVVSVQGELIAEVGSMFPRINKRADGGGIIPLKKSKIIDFREMAAMFAKENNE